jgi:uncharacterized coiled-coil protein SlyX
MTVLLGIIGLLILLIINLRSSGDPIPTISSQDTVNIEKHVLQELLRTIEKAQADFVTFKQNQLSASIGPIATSSNDVPISITSVSIPDVMSVAQIPSKTEVELKSKISQKSKQIAELKDQLAQSQRQVTKMDMMLNEMIDKNATMERKLSESAIASSSAPSPSSSSNSQLGPSNGTNMNGTMNLNGHADSSSPDQATNAGRKRNLSLTRQSDRVNGISLKL